MELGWEQLQEAALPTGLSPVLIITENNATITIIQLGYLRTKYQFVFCQKQKDAMLPAVSILSSHQKINANSQK
jgi:hypothetical protein